MKKKKNHIAFNLFNCIVFYCYKRAMWWARDVFLRHISRENIILGKQRFIFLLNVAML